MDEIKGGVGKVTTEGARNAPWKKLQLTIKTPKEKSEVFGGGKHEGGSRGVEKGD